MPWFESRMSWERGSRIEGVLNSVKHIGAQKKRGVASGGTTVLEYTYNVTVSLVEAQYLKLG